MNSQWRDLFIFIILVAIGCYIWASKQHTPPKPAPEPVKAQEEAPQQKVLDKKFLLTYKFNLRLTNLEALDKAILTIPVPKTSGARQNISDVKFSGPAGQISTLDDTKYAKITFTDFVHQSPEVTMKMKANLHIYDYQRAVQLNKNFDTLKERSRYLQAEKNIEVNSVTVKAAANLIKAKTNIDILKGIVDYMQKNIELGHVTGTIGAEKTLKNRLAGTSDYANTFVALARAKGIPARVVSGYRIVGITARRHAWAEVYFQKYGWVTFDPHNSPVDITELHAFYVVSAYNSFTADSLETFYESHQKTGQVSSDVEVKEL